MLVLIVQEKLFVNFQRKTLGYRMLVLFWTLWVQTLATEPIFATVASSIGPQDVPIALGGNSPISLDVQFAQFSDFHRRSQILRKQGESHVSFLF